MRFFGGGKPKEREYSGFMGDTSEEQDKVLAQFKEWVEVTGIGDLKAMHFDDYDLLRFCRARKFQLDQMQIMWQNFINWRKEQEVENIIETFQYEEYDKVIEVYPHGYHNIDKLGRPIYIERFGIMDIEKLWTVTTRERCVRHYTQEYEKMMKIRFPVCSMVAGKKIQQGFTIIDMTGGGVSTANPSTKELFQLAAQVGSDYYPETMGHTFIVNAPMLFRGIWKVAKGFLDERTRNKIAVKGEKYLEFLLEYADKEALPVFLGGTDETPFPCDKGPWQEWECVDNKLRKKGSNAEGQEEAKTEEVTEQKPAATDNAQEEKPVAQDTQEEAKQPPSDQDKPPVQEQAAEEKPAVQEKAPEEQPAAQEQEAQKQLEELKLEGKEQE